MMFIHNPASPASGFTYDLVDFQILPHRRDRLCIVTSEHGIEEIFPVTQKVGWKEPDNWRRDKAQIAKIAADLKRYFSGYRIAWEHPLVLRGTPFQTRVWEEIAAIPYGHSITYSELAEKAGNKDAIRAAASACGANPIPVIIPCHRVLAKNGGLGGFGWGLPYKEAMLTLERHAKPAAFAA